MTYLASCCLALCALLAPAALCAGPLSTDVSQKSKPVTLKVLLSKEVKDAIVEVKGRYFIYNPLNDLLITSGVNGKRHILSPAAEGIRWGGVLPGIQQVRIVPGDSQSSILVDGIQYKGCVEAYVVNGVLNIVNEIDVENYLKAVLATQFPEPISAEAMDAVAIVARTELYHTISKHTHGYWHVDAHAVGYEGDGLLLQSPHVDKAVDNTRHMIMTYQHLPFAAAWTKDSAGKTAAFASIFRKDCAAPAGVLAPFAARGREQRSWTLTVPKEQLARIARTSGVNRVDLFQDSSSGKVYALRFTDAFESKDVDFFTLQNALGKHRLLSNDFAVSVKKDSVLFSGHGEGHGVGLCLYSALKMAEKGERAPKILSAFFPNTDLENIRTYSSLEQHLR
jgi:SpoIID/LytB domain protein